MANQLRKKQEQAAFRDILTEQMQMGKMRKQLEKQEVLEPSDVHFGPQEDNELAHMHAMRQKQHKEILNEKLKEQMNDEETKKRKLMTVEKMKDSINTRLANDRIKNEIQDARAQDRNSK